MPFGLVNAPATFQRAMTHTLQGCEEFDVVYINDIFVFSKDKTAHSLHLNAVFSVLLAQFYHVNIDKCQFFICSVRNLGHVLTPEGFHAAPEKLKFLSAFPTLFPAPSRFAPSWA